MWKTRDGQQLRLLRSDLQRIGRRGRRRARAGRGDFRIARPVSALARRARRVGTLRYTDCDCRYPVFGGDADDRPFRLVGRPLADGSNAIVSIWLGRGRFALEGAVGEAEEEMSRTVKGKLHWVGPLSIAAARSVRGGGLYMITVAGEACYIGRTNDFSVRLAAHFRSKRCKLAPPEQWRVWIGRVAPLRGAAPKDPAVWRRFLSGVEHAVVRTALRPFEGKAPAGTGKKSAAQGGSKLDNKTSHTAFNVVGKLRIDQTGALPDVAGFGGKRKKLRPLVAASNVRATVPSRGKPKRRVLARDGSVYEFTPA